MGCSIHVAVFHAHLKQLAVGKCCRARVCRARHQVKGPLPKTHACVPVPIADADFYEFATYYGRDRALGSGCGTTVEVLVKPTAGWFPCVLCRHAVHVPQGEAGQAFGDSGQGSLLSGMYQHGGVPFSLFKLLQPHDCAAQGHYVTFCLPFPPHTHVSAQAAAYHKMAAGDPGFRVRWVGVKCR